MYYMTCAVICDLYVYCIPPTLVCIAFQACSEFVSDQLCARIRSGVTVVVAARDLTKYIKNLRGNSDCESSYTGELGTPESAEGRSSPEGLKPKARNIWFKCSYEETIIYALRYSPCART